MKKQLFIFLLVFGYLSHAQEDEKETKVAPLITTLIKFNGSCDEAKELIKSADEKKEIEPAVYMAAMQKVQECYFMEYAESKLGSKPKGFKEEYKSEVLVVYDFKDDKRYYGIIRGKELKKLKKISLEKGRSIGLKVAQTEPVTGAIIIITSEISINSFYEAALQEDPTLILYPVALPGIKGFKTFVGLFGEDVAIDVEKIHAEFIEDFKAEIKNAGEIVQRNPLYIANPAWAATAEISEKVYKKAKENPASIIMPIQVPGVQQVLDVLDW